jgi:hypothetical protein
VPLISVRPGNGRRNGCRIRGKSFFPTIGTISPDHAKSAKQTRSSLDNPGPMAGRFSFHPPATMNARLRPPGINGTL